MLWLVKQSTLTWLLLTFMFPRTLFKLQSAMSSPDLTSPAQPSPGQPGQFSDSGEIRNFAKCLHIVHALCSLLGPPSDTATCWRGEILLNRDPAANKILPKYKNAFCICSTNSLRLILRLIIGHKKQGTQIQFWRLIILNDLDIATTLPHFSQSSTYIGRSSSISISKLPAGCIFSPLPRYERCWM